MTTQTQKDLGIMSNMSDERLLKLFGKKKLKDIPAIPDASGFKDRLRVKKRTKKKKSRKT
jgi:hypothetical protein